MTNTIKPVPPNPAAATVAAANARTLPPTAPAVPRRFSDKMRVLLGKHAAERSELETQQWNEKVDVSERQASEVAALNAEEAPPEETPAK